MKSVSLLLVLIVGLAGCGGRSGLTTSGGGSTRGDGKTAALDGGGNRDAAAGTDARLSDGPRPRDHGNADSCLPIPASQVQGSYSGTWKGTWTCPGMSPTSVGGTLSLALSPAGTPNSFKVKGALKGTVQPVMSFSGSITGNMGCVSLAAKMNDILVSSGAIIYKLAGTMKGIFSLSSAKQGFQGGSWSVKEQSGTCGASGSWGASM